MSDSEHTPTPPPTGSSSTTASEDYGEFPPGTIVLAKLKSFPPWPAIVIPDGLIPDRIQASRPKSTSRPASHRGKRKSHVKNASSEQQQPSSRLWCVRFLRDDTFMWATSSDISLLTTAQIEAFLKSKKAKKVIKSAYEMALDPPDVEEFIIYGSDGKPMDIDNEANDEDFKEDDFTPEEDDDEDEEIQSDVVDDDNDLEITPVKKTPSKRTKSTPTKKSTKKTKIAPKTKTSSKKGKKQTLEPPEFDPDTSSDEDWDADVDPNEDPVCTDYPNPKKIADEIKKRTPLFKKARLQLQKAFLSGPEIPNDLSTISNTLDTLEDLHGPQISLINKAGLHKVLFTILRRPDLESKDLKKIRNRISDLVHDWYSLEVPVQENWTFDDAEDVEDVKSEIADSSVTNENTAEIKGEA